MDFELSQRQRDLQLMARAFARDDVLPFADEWGQRGAFPVKTLREAGALGFGGIYVRGDVGGAALSCLDGTIIFEELAQGCVATAAYLSIHNLAAWIIDAFGSNEQQRRFLPDLCAMTNLASCCLTERGAGSDVASLKTRAVRHLDQYVIDGEKAFVSGGDAVDVYVVMARTGESGPKGISCFLVENGTPGLSFSPPENTLGWNSQPIATAMFENCHVPVVNRIGTEGQGFEIAGSIFKVGRLNVAACSLGGAQFCLDRTIAYLIERQQLNDHSVDVPMLCFRIADYATELEAARLLLRRAALAADNAAPDATRLIAMAKRLATDSGFTIASGCLQIHGSDGFLCDRPVERVLRDLRMHQILDGTNEMMRRIVSRDLLGSSR